MGRGDPGSVVFVPSVDLECILDIPLPPVTPLFTCSRASVQDLATCNYGRTGSLTVFIDSRKMFFESPQYCRINSHAQIVTTSRIAPSSRFWYRSP
jgi:hypothetical protein